MNATSIRLAPDPERQTFVKEAGEGTLSRSALRELLQAVLGRGKPFRFQAKGSSMAPFILEGDVVTVAPLTGRAPGRGEIVAYLEPNSGKVVVHRVVGKHRTAWIIKGDRFAQPSVEIPEANLLGKVTRVERNGRRMRSGLGPERLLIPWLTRHPRILAAVLPLRWSARRVLREGPLWLVRTLQQSRSRIWRSGKS